MKLCTIVLLCLITATGNSQTTSTPDMATVPRRPLIRLIVTTEIKDSLLIGYRKEIAVKDSINAAQQATISTQLRQLARLEGITAANEKITGLYEAKEADLKKQLKRARTGTTLTGLAGIAVTVLAVVLLR